MHVMLQEAIMLAQKGKKYFAEVVSIQILVSFLFTLLNILRVEREEC